MRQYLLRTALDGAQLIPSTGAEALEKSAFEKIARQFLLAVAVIERLSRRMDIDVLYALLKQPKLDLLTKNGAETGAARLAATLGGEDMQCAARFDEAEGRWSIEIERMRHGITHVTTLDPDFVQTGDYEQMAQTAEILDGLIQTGAEIRRGDASAAIREFKDALDWLLVEAKRGLGIQRYKGLGEMNPGQLWETTMDPSVRRLLRVQIEDAIAADEIFTTLMGEEVEPRRRFIETNALGVRNLDV